MKKKMTYLVIERIVADLDPTRALEDGREKPSHVTLMSRHDVRRDDGSVILSDRTKKELTQVSLG